MNDLIADTHSIIWYLFDPPRLSKPAKLALVAAAQNGTIFISAITIVEVIYLSEKKSFPYPGVFPHLLAVLDDPNEPIEILPLTLQVARGMDRILRNEVPDMPDRIIAATAVEHKLRLVSVDSDIRNSASLAALVSVIW